MGSTLIFGSPHHHNTTSKVERVNGVVEDVLRAFVNDRQDNWPELTPLVEFAINDAASLLGTCYTPFFADQGQHPRRPIAPPDEVEVQAAVGGGATLAWLMDHVTGEVRALLQERQDLRKARLDPSRRDVRFEPGDEVLLDTSHAPLPSRGPLSSRWMGPFKVRRQTAPNTYQLELPPTWKAVDEFNVARLRRYHRRPEWMGREEVEPAPIVVSPGAPPEHEVHEILRYRLCRGRPQCLVRWTGKDASGDTWVPVENLTNCESALRDFEAAQGIRVGGEVSLGREPGRGYGMF